MTDTVDWSTPKDDTVDWSTPKESTPVPAAEKPAEPSAVDSLFTTVRGYGQGVTAGLIQYPQAALMQAANGGTFSGNLADLRGENDTLAKTQPKAWYGGNIAGVGTLAYLSGGGATPTLAKLGAGEMLPAMIGTTTGKMIAGNVAQGAVSGFTEKDSLTDAALGGIIGGTIGAGGKIISGSADWLGNEIARANVAGKIDAMLANKPSGYIDFLKKTFGSDTGNEAIQAAKDYSTVLKEAKAPIMEQTKAPIEAMYKDIASLPMAARSDMATMDALAQKNGFRDYHEFSAQNQGIAVPGMNGDLGSPAIPLRPTGKKAYEVQVSDYPGFSQPFSTTSASQHLKTFTGGLTSTGKGVLFGLGLDWLAGENNPIGKTGAVISGAVIGGAQKVVRQKATDLITKGVINEMSSIAPQVTSAVTQSTVPPVVRSKLSQMADDFRKRFNPDTQQEPGYYDVPGDQTGYQ